MTARFSRQARSQLASCCTYKTGGHRPPLQLSFDISQQASSHLSTMSQHSSPYQTFIASMTIDVEKWRDGIGFDLEALKQVTPSERDTLVKTLEDRLKASGDWREIEALAAIGTTEAIDIIRQASKSGSSETRLHAAKQLAEIEGPESLDAAIVEGLRNTRLFGGFSKALDLAEQHPSPRIQEALVDLSLNGTEEQRIHCAAMALYLGGKADEAFDWNHRPFFLRFGDNDRNVQIEAYKELCSRLGVTPKI
jgi:hypothetical protein